jgi:GT2 family glycosyltransferase
MNVNSIRSAIVICTKDRPREVEMACNSAAAAAAATPIVVVDASDTEATERVCERLASARAAEGSLIYRRARVPGLTRQRNQSIETCRELDVEVVHFIDDDTEVLGGYFDAIDHRFEGDPELMGVGGVVVNQPRLDYVRLKRFFLLAGRPGTVLRSGRNVLGQYPDARATDPVEWLRGCSMSYRLAVFDDLWFDSGREGVGPGEDCDFSYRLGRSRKLAVEPSARCVHHLTDTNRASVHEKARSRTVATHSWVRENRTLGFSPAAFWWSAFGDFLLRAGYGAIYRDRKMLEESLGVLHGGAAIRGESLRPR